MVRLGFSCVWPLIVLPWVDCIFASFSVRLYTDIYCSFCPICFFPYCVKTTFTYCWEPIPCGLGDTNRCSLLSCTAFKPQQLKNGHVTLARLRSVLNRTCGTTWKKLLYGDPRNQEPCKLELRRNLKRLARVEKDLSSDLFFSWRPSIQLCLKPALPPDFKVLWANKVPFLFKIIELGFCPG